MVPRSAYSATQFQAFGLSCTILFGCAATSTTPTTEKLLPDETCTAQPQAIAVYMAVFGMTGGSPLEPHDQEFSFDLLFSTSDGFSGQLRGFQLGKQSLAMRYADSLEDAAFIMRLASSDGFNSFTELEDYANPVQRTQRRSKRPRNVEVWLLAQAQTPVGVAITSGIFKSAEQGRIDVQHIWARSPEHAVKLVACMKGQAGMPIEFKSHDSWRPGRRTIVDPDDPSQPLRRPADVRVPQKLNSGRL